MSTCFGVGVFLVLLTFASHVLLNLWTLSTLDAVAHDAATDVATSGTDAEHLAAVETEAIRRAREALGSWGEHAEIRVAASSIDDPVVVTVSGPSLSLLPEPVAAALGLHHLERTATVQRELV
ncbi:MAG TPA: hypothetical protein PLP95_09230, partial [Microthrixaceae bacterium]|nr:hypothetical protein [Microthrixaceae bacterium]